MRTGLICFVTCAPWSMWTSGRERLGINTSIVFMGCEQPMNTMEVFIPNLSRPEVHMLQGAQVTKQISPVRIGQPGEGHAAVVREIAGPRGDRSKDSGSG